MTWIQHRYDNERQNEDIHCLSVEPASHDIKNEDRDHNSRKYANGTGHRFFQYDSCGGEMPRVLQRRRQFSSTLKAFTSRMLLRESPSTVGIPSRHAAHLAFMYLGWASRHRLLYSDALAPVSPIKLHSLLYGHVPRIRLASCSLRARVRRQDRHSLQLAFRPIS